MIFSYENMIFIMIHIVSHDIYRQLSVVKAGSRLGDLQSAQTLPFTAVGPGGASPPKHILVHFSSKFSHLMTLGTACSVVEAC